MGIQSVNLRGYTANDIEILREQIDQAVVHFGGLVFDGLRRPTLENVAAAARQAGAIERALLRYQELLTIHGEG